LGGEVQQWETKPSPLRRDIDWLAIRITKLKTDSTYRGYDLTTLQEQTEPVLAALEG
jgi:hypothetical protein